MLQHSSLSPLITVLLSQPPTQEEENCDTLNTLFDTSLGFVKQSYIDMWKQFVVMAILSIIQHPPQQGS